MRTGKWLRLGLALISPSALSACADGGAQPSAEPEGSLELYDATTAEHGAAIEALQAELHAAFPKITSTRIFSVGPDDSSTRITSDSFNAFNRGQVQEWVGSADDQTGSQLSNLEELFARGGFSDVFPRELLDEYRIGGALWAVPIDVRRNNLLFYAPSLLSEAGFDRPPQTLEELRSVCAAFAEAGKTCIALGAVYGWTLAHWILDEIFPALAGGEHSRRFLRGELEGDDELFVRSLETATELLAFANEDCGEIDFPEAGRRVAAGEAVFEPVGEWALELLVNDGWQRGRDFQVAVYPGSQGVFVFESTSWVGTAGTDNPKAVDAWLEVVASERGQIAFNLAQGSIPARRVAKVNEFDGYAQQAIADFDDPLTERVPAMWGILPRDVGNELNQQLADFAASRDVTALRRWFMDNYSRFRR